MNELDVNLAQIWPGMMYEASRILLVWPLLLGILVEWPIYWRLMRMPPLAGLWLSLGANIASTVSCLVAMAFVDVLLVLLMSFTFSVLQSMGIPVSGMWELTMVVALIVDVLLATFVEYNVIRRFLRSHFALLHAVRQPETKPLVSTVFTANLASLAIGFLGYLVFQQQGWL